VDDRHIVEAIFTARAHVLADLEARSLGTAASVTLLESSCAERRWWLEQWPDGTDYIAGLVAQDVQDGLADEFGRGTPQGLWPVCRECRGPVHALHIDPDLGGPDPHWVCEESGRVVAALGSLPRG
jgi:hypothetical protein